MKAPFNFKKFKNKILITNDLGRYEFLDKNEFKLFINNEIPHDSLLYQRLEKNYFIFDSSFEYFAERYKQELRYGKSYIFSATSLHIFVVTNYCNSQCVYCQAKSNSKNGCKLMSKEIAEKSVRIAMESPQKELNFEFQGGEPLSNYPIIKHIIEYSKKINKDKIIRYNVVTNLSLLTDDMLDYFIENDVSISTSIDGNKMLHNLNRPLVSNKDSFSVLEKSITRLKEKNKTFGAIQTTTKMGLPYYKELVDQYLKFGINNIFIRPLTPLGIALEKWDTIGYSPNEFLDFYKKTLLYILELNKQGVQIKEGHASIFLSKILNGFGLNYMELRSPCGAGVGQLAYYYDGNIFTCDEGRMLEEMGNNSFKIGNVFENNYNDLMNSKVCKAVCKFSILESLPKCSDCAYLPYCGTCPVINYASEKDIISRTYNNYRCSLYEGMLDIIFELLENIEYESILRSWC